MMEPTLVIVGLLIMLLGAGIWRFQWIHLLSNVRTSEVQPSKKGDLARFAGRYLILVGGVSISLAFVIQYTTTERQLLIPILLAVVGIFVATGIYLSRLGRYLKK